jgi:ankyrin repeat protein
MRYTKQCRRSSKYLLLNCLVLFLFTGEAFGQLAPVDTSYFKPGDRDNNLVEAAIKSDTFAVRLLLERSTDPNAVSSVGNSALMYAIETGNMINIMLLTERGADVNFSGFNGETPLFLAVFHNDFEAAKYLLEQGADPNVKDAFGVTPLIYAAATNQYQSADLLLFYDADEDMRDQFGNDPLIAAVTFENIETSDVLLQNGLDPDVQDARGNTPLIIATQHGTYDILQLLLDYNADVEIANEKNYTPLAYAVVYEDTTAMGALIRHGADVNHRISRGRNIAEIARISGNREIMEYLDQNGAARMRQPDFSEVHFTSGHAFNGTDYLVRFRGSLVDSKYGYYAQTGLDYRPFLLRYQVSRDDTVYQYRERRIGWSHGVGKYVTLVRPDREKQLAAYASLTGYLSFPTYSGSSYGPAAAYTVIPGAGLAFSGHYIGVKTGLEWFRFGNMLENGLKVNFSIFVRLIQPENHYDRKEIYWQ